MMQTMSLGPQALARERAFEAVYREHFSRVYHLALRYAAGSTVAAEDIAHDVFVKLYKRFSQLSGSGDLSGWLYRVTAREAISARRSRQRMLERLGAWLSAQPQQEAPSPERMLSEQREASRVLAAMRQLPPKERVVVMLKLIDDKTQREIAEVTQLSEGYVSKLLARGTARLKKQGWR